MLQNQLESAFPHLEEPALTGLLGELVGLACAESEASPAAVLFTALTFAAASFGAVSYFPVGDTRHPPRLFVSIVGESARARKGTSAQPVERIFKRAQELAGLPVLHVTPGPFSSGEGIIFAVRDASDILKKGEPVDMGVSDKRLLGLLGEFGGSLAAMKRDGSTLSAVLRTAWEAGDIKPLTKNSQIKTTGAHINFVGHVTKMELEALLGTSDIWNGLGNRILWVCAKREKLVPISIPMDAVAVDKIGASLAAAIKFGQSAGRITFSAGAEEVWRRDYSQITDDRSGVFGVITARAEAQIVRLSMIYALLDKAIFIEPEHLAAGRAAWSYAEKSAAYLFGGVVGDPRAERILSALKDGPQRRSALHRLFKNNLRATELENALQKLIAEDLICEFDQLFYIKEITK